MDLRRDPALTASLEAGCATAARRAKARRGPTRRGNPHPQQQFLRWTRNSRKNIGIACGPAGLLVVDLDIPAGTDGAQVLAALAAEAGTLLAPTYTVGTPSGGQHRYYTVTPGQVARTTTGLLASQVDTRGAGGCVLAAGSVRRLRGGPGFYRVSHAGPAAPLPSWLAALLAAPWQSPRTGPLSTVRRPGAYAAAAVTGEAGRVRHAAIGTRNAVLFSAAARLGRLSAQGMLPTDQAYDALRAAADPHIGVAGFTPAEADRTIRNGLHHGQRRTG
jgi:hypothetical protein